MENSRKRLIFILVVRFITFLSIIMCQFIILSEFIKDLRIYHFFQPDKYLPHWYEKINFIMELITVPWASSDMLVMARPSLQTYWDVFIMPNHWLVVVFLKLFICMMLINISQIFFTQDIIYHSDVLKKDK